MKRFSIVFLSVIIAFAGLYQPGAINGEDGRPITGLVRATVLVYESETGGDFIWTGTTDGSLPSLKLENGYIHNIDLILPGYVRDRGELWIEVRLDGLSVTDGRIRYSAPADRALHRDTPPEPGEISETLEDELQIGLPGHELYVASATTGFGVETPVEKVDIDGAVGLKQQVTPPTATTDFGKVYVDDSDGHLYFMDEAGTSTDLLETTSSTGGGGSFMAAFSKEHINACIDKTVYIDAHIGGGTEPYTHLWTGDTAPLSATDIPNPSFTATSAGIYSLVYTIEDADGVKSYFLFTVEVHADPTPSITASPASGGCEGEPVILSGDDCFQKYCWNPGGPCTKTFDVSEGGTYELTVTDEWGCKGTDSYTVTFLDPPVANSGSNVAECFGGTDPTLGGSPAATAGTPPYIYEWTGSGLPYLSSPNASNPTFSVSTATPGVYSVSLTVSDANGCTDTDGPVLITVYDNPVASASASSPVCEGNTLSLSGGATSGTGPYSFSWTGPAGFTSFAQSPTITSVTTANAGTYQVTVTDAHGCVSSAASATAVVNTLPAITVNPTDEAVCEGLDATFSVTATGTGPLTYQWQRNPGALWVDISGATTSTLGLTAVTTWMDGYLYRCVVSGVCPPAVTSTQATLTVHAAPVITGDITSATICEGDDHTFTVTATGYALTYQWQINEGSGWSDMSGETGASLAMTSVSASLDGNIYRCIVSGGCSPDDVSAEATLVVNLLPNITSHPADQAVDEGDPASFSVTATGTGLSYQWQRSTDGGSTWADLSGATATTYTISSTTLGMSGYQFHCIVSGTCSPAQTSTAATLTVATHGTVTFGYTGSEQTWTVPTGVTSVTIECWGAEGGRGYNNGILSNAGRGGYVSGNLAVTPGSTLYINVGGEGAEGSTGTDNAGGWNGGGQGSYGDTWGGAYSGGGGGGATDVRYGGNALSNRVIVGGGGGGGSYYVNSSGGNGGYAAGTDGLQNGSVTSSSGRAGTQTGGGAGATSYRGSNVPEPGGLGYGGNSDWGTSGGCSGGGGSGYYGGGGGGHCNGGGGGGGSTYYGGVTGYTYTNGTRTGNGQAVITW